MELSLEEATEFFEDFFFGSNHFPSKIKRCGNGWEINTFSDLSTYDFNHLTRLVVMAHDRAIRVCIMPVNFRYMKITIHKRDRSSNSMTRHPELEEAVQWIRSQGSTNKSNFTPSKK